MLKLTRFAEVMVMMREGKWRYPREAINGSPDSTCFCRTKALSEIAFSISIVVRCGVNALDMPCRL